MRSQERSREGRSREGSSGRAPGDMPRHFMQLSEQDSKTYRGFQMVQELQIMVCSRDNGIRGNAARARTMVLLKEVQAMLVGLENRIDAQNFEIGVLNLERTEMRKEIRNEKAKEAAPFHTIDYRSTDVRELPHKMRALFEDNQVLREQVRQLQYSVRSAETRLAAAEKRTAQLEGENASLTIALRDLGASPDAALAMRRLQQEAQQAALRSRQLEDQLSTLLQQAEADRATHNQQVRNYMLRTASLEERLARALGVAPHSRGGPPLGQGMAMGGGWVGGPMGLGSPGSGSVSRRSLPALGHPAGGGGAGGAAMAEEPSEEASASSVVGAPQPHMYGRMPEVGGAAYGNMAAAMQQDGGGGSGSGSGSGMLPPAFVRTYVGGPGSTAGASLSVRSRSPTGRSVGAGPGAAVSPGSPPRSPTGKSISHSPGMTIPSHYPAYNLKPRSLHSFSANSPKWSTNAAAAANVASSGYGGQAPLGFHSFLERSGEPSPTASGPNHQLPLPEEASQEAFAGLHGAGGEGEESVAAYGGYGSGDGGAGGGGGLRAEGSRQSVASSRGGGGGGGGSVRQEESRRSVASSRGTGGGGGGGGVGIELLLPRRESGLSALASDIPDIPMGANGLANGTGSGSASGSRRGTGTGSGAVGGDSRIERGESVRAINSAAVVTSRQLLPSVSGGSFGSRKASGTGGAAVEDMRRLSYSSQGGGGGGGGGLTSLEPLGSRAGSVSGDGAGVGRPSSGGSATWVPPVSLGVVRASSSNIMRGPSGSGGGGGGGRMEVLGAEGWGGGVPGGVRSGGGSRVASASNRQVGGIGGGGGSFREGSALQRGSASGSVRGSGGGEEVFMRSESGASGRGMGVAVRESSGYGGHDGAIPEAEHEGEEPAGVEGSQLSYGHGNNYHDQPGEQHGDSGEDMHLLAAALGAREEQEQEEEEGAGEGRAAREQQQQQEEAEVVVRASSIGEEERAELLRLAAAFGGEGGEQLREDGEEESGSGHQGREGDEGQGGEEERGQEPGDNLGGGAQALHGQDDGEAGRGEEEEGTEERVVQGEGESGEGQGLGHVTTTGGGGDGQGEVGGAPGNGGGGGAPEQGRVADGGDAGQGQLLQQGQEDLGEEWQGGSADPAHDEGLGTAEWQPQQEEEEEEHVEVALGAQGLGARGSSRGSGEGADAAFEEKEEEQLPAASEDGVEDIKAVGEKGGMEEGFLAEEAVEEGQEEAVVRLAGDEDELVFEQKDGV